MKILHVSDVHVDVPPSAIPLRDWFGKRAVGGANHALRRARHFRHARVRLEELARFATDEGADLVLSTGDHTILGTEPELAAAAAAVAPLSTRPHGLVALAGNHDVYLPDGVREQRFEKHFAKYITDDLGGADGAWPRVRLVGAEVAIVTVKSARPNPAVWRSSGRIDDDELVRLRERLADPRLAGRFVVVATHYAPRRADGTPDRPLHGLENADAFLEIVRDLPWGCVVHGHIHQRFRLDLPGVRPPILCAGSSTYEGREGVWWIEVEGDEAHATPGRRDAAGYVLEGVGRATLGRRAST